MCSYYATFPTPPLFRPSVATIPIPSPFNITHPVMPDPSLSEQDIPPTLNASPIFYPLTLTHSSIPSSMSLHMLTHVCTEHELTMHSKHVRYMCVY